jgi:hypothetical protein
LPHRLAQIIAQLEGHIAKLVVNNCGCRVVQKMFERYAIDRLRGLVDEVLKSAADIAVNQYGNYIVQNILAAGSDNDITQLVNAFTGNFYALSLHKFASNVIEKCIRRASPAQRNAVFIEIIGNENHWEDARILKMVADQFGNYVIQRIIEFGTEPQQRIIFDIVYENYDDLVKRPYAKHVIASLHDLGCEF